MASRARGADLGCAPRLRADSALGSDSKEGVGAVPGPDVVVELDGGALPASAGSGCGFGNSSGGTLAARGLSGQGCCGHG
eukprot:8781543-Alexandrium_andersonii.AAC.1